DVAEMRLPEQCDEIVVTLHLAGHSKDRIDHDPELGGFDPRRERDSTDSVTKERQGEVVFARTRRVERNLLGEDVVRCELQDQGAVFFEQALQLAGKLES